MYKMMYLAIGTNMLDIINIISTWDVTLATQGGSISQNLNFPVAN